MPLRLVDVTVPDDERDHIATIVSSLPVIEVQTIEVHGENALLRVLLDAKHVEQLSDALIRHFGPREDFRMVSLPVEVTIPPVEKKEVVEEEDNQSGTRKPAPRISREELYADVAESADLTWVFAATVVLSTVVAAVGLLRGDVAIVIGAMVIAPLLGPNIALALAATLGDLDLAWRSLKTTVIGVALALGLSVALGLVLNVDPDSPQLVTRAQIDLADLALALAAGAAGSLAFTTGVPAVVVGVMVAVALLPPLVVTGLYLGSGFGALALRSALLVLANIACINLAAVATFVVQKVRPRTWWETKKARKATFVAAMVWTLTLIALIVLIVAGGRLTG